MRDTIERLIDIDNQAKKVINECEEKENHLDNFVTIELEKRKREINSNYQYKLNFIKSEFEKKLDSDKDEIKQKMNSEIQKIQNEYNQNKNRKIDEIFEKIIKID